MSDLICQMKMECHSNRVKSGVGHIYQSVRVRLVRYISVYISGQNPSDTDGQIYYIGET